MKRILYILAAATIISSSCQKEEKSIIAGQWNLTDLQLATKSAQIGDQTVDVYIDFRNDGSYEMYQMVGQGRYNYYKGVYTLNGNLLTGKYHDLNNISNWGSSYNVEVSKDQLVLTTANDAAEVYNYTRCTIPAEVKAQAIR